MKSGLSLFWRVAVIQLIWSLILVLLLHDTEIMRDPGFVFYKPTLMLAAFAVLLGLSLAVSKNGVIHLLAGKRLMHAPAFWRGLTAFLAALLAALAIANVVMAHVLSFESWVTYKTVIAFPVELLACIAFPQLSMIRNSALQKN